MRVGLDKGLDGLGSVDVFEVEDGLVAFADGFGGFLKNLLVLLRFGDFGLHFVSVMVY